MQASFDFGEFPVLGAARAELCEYDAKYARDIFAIRGDPEVQLYNSAPHQTLAETLQFIEEERELYRLKKEVIWAVKLRQPQRVVGSVSIADWDRYHRRATIGYDLARDCWGLGLAQEAIREVLRFGFERMALNRIEIWTSTANARSLRLAERLGFTRDGTLRKRILEDDGQFLRQRPVWPAAKRVAARVPGACMMYVIFIHGPAAAGKYTIGCQLAIRTGLPLFHNHLAVDAAKALFEFGSPSFNQLRRTIWRTGFSEAAATRRSFIFTFNPEASVEPALINELVSSIEAVGGRVLFVQLACSRESILARLNSASRSHFGKLTDPKLYCLLEQQGAFEFPPLPPPIVTIDTDNVSPANAAASIVRALEPLIGRLEPLSVDGSGSV